LPNHERGDDTKYPSTNKKPNWIFRSVSRIKHHFQQRHAAKKQEDPQDRASRRTANATVAVAFLTVAVIVVGVLQYLIFKAQLKVMADQLIEMKGTGTQTDKIIDAAVKQAQAATESVSAIHAQLDVMKGQLNVMEAGQRPWVGATIEPIKLVFDDQRGKMFLDITIKNTGAVPATDTFVNPALFTHVKQPYMPIDVLKSECGKYGIGGGNWHTLFKDDSLRQIMAPDIKRSEFPQDFAVYLAVCVKYKLPNSSKIVSSGYLFMVLRSDPEYPGAAFSIIPNNGTIFPPILALVPSGSYAD
jgi:hypothetical protein